MATSLGVPHRINGDIVRLQTLLENVMQVFRQSVDALQEQDCAVASEISSDSGGEHPAVQQIMQDVRELGRRPKELKNPVSAAQLAEYKLARKVRKNKLKERVQDMLESLTRSQEIPVRTLLAKSRKTPLPLTRRRQLYF